MIWGKLFSIFVLLIFLHVTAGAQDAPVSVDYFINQALHKSPLIRDYKNQALQNAIDSQKIRATLLPQINATTTNSYAPVVNGYGYDGAITNGANISAVIGLNKSFTSQKNIASQFRTISLLSSGTRNLSDISVQELTRSVISQYITLYGDQQQLQYSRETSHLLKREDTLLKRLTESNVYRQTDYLTFLVTLQQQELATHQAEIQFQNDYLTLFYLCGIADTSMVPLEEPAFAVKAPPEPENSVFFRQYTLDSLKILNERSILDYTYKPKFNVFADAGYVTSKLRLPYNNFGTSFGFSLTVPIYDGRQRYLQYRKLDIQEETRAGYRDFFSRQYNLQVSRLSKQLSATQQLLEDIKKQIKYSESLINVNNKLLATGDVRIADLIISINSYMAAKFLLTQNTVAKLQIINEINYWYK